MSPRTRGIDRFVTALVGLLLVAGGLVVLDWRYDVLLGLGQRLDLGPVHDVLVTDWWPWASAVAGVVLGLVGLRWLLAHLTTPNGTVVRTLNDDDQGSTRLDLSSLATATADRFADLAPVVSTGGSYRRIDGHHVVEVRAAVDDRTSAALLAEAVRTVDTDLQAAFEDGAAHLRVLLGSPARIGSAISRTPLGRPADASTARVDRPASGSTRREDPQMGIADKAKNAAEDLVGKAKEAVGDLTDDKSLETEGKKDQASSSVKDAGEDLKDAFKK